MKNLIFGLVCLGVTVDGITKDNWRQQIKRAALAELSQSGAPSFQIAVARGEVLVYQQAFGFADIENQVRATNETKYRIASVSKWLTATATMRLAEQGKIDLDKNVQTYCPQYPHKKWPATSRNLLTHTAGVRHYTDYQAAFDNAQSSSERTKVRLEQYRDELSAYSRYTDTIMPLATFKDAPLKFKPSSDWSYTSHGYRILGCVLAGASGKSYRALMQSLIFAPLKMTSTLEDDAWRIIPFRASGYRIQESGELRRADMRDVSENLPAGGYLSSASDLSLFSQAFFNYKILPKNTVELMTKPYQALNDDTDPAPSWRNAIPSKGKYGYGVMTFDLGQQEWKGHTGRQAGGSAIVVWIPKKRLSISILTNVKGWRGYISFMQKIEAIFTQEVLASFET